MKRFLNYFLCGIACLICAAALMMPDGMQAAVGTSVRAENIAGVSKNESSGGLPENGSASETAYQVWIDDAADLLTDEEEEELAEQMSELVAYGNMMFTTVTLTNKNYVNYSENAYYERFGNEPGVNLQIDMGNRKLTLSCSTGMEDELGSERDSIVDNIYTYASDGDYAGCAEECFLEIDNILHDREISHRMKYINNAIVALVLGLLINFFFVAMTLGGGNSKKNQAKFAKNVKTGVVLDSVNIRKTSVRKVYDPESSHSGGGIGGGGFSGGGGGGGGFSGGSSSHGF